MLANAIPKNTPDAASVMIVEDDQPVAFALNESLAAAGYRIVGTAPDSVGAIRLAQQRHPDVALVDITLAGPIDGITTARYLAETMGIPIVFLTGHVEEAIREGFDVSRFVVGKPCSEDDLLGAVKDALAARRH